MKKSSGARHNVIQRLVELSITEYSFDQEKSTPTPLTVITTKSVTKNLLAST